VSINHAFVTHPRFDGDEAPMRRPINPPTRQQFWAPTLIMLQGLGIVDRECREMWDINEDETGDDLSPLFF
jgi:hypothetical protein